MFDYELALVRGLPSSFPQGLVLQPPPVPIDMGRAQQQHEAYTALLRELISGEAQAGKGGATVGGGGERVVEVPADEVCPDCVFIEVWGMILRMNPCCMTIQRWPFPSETSPLTSCQVLFCTALPNSGHAPLSGPLAHYHPPRCPREATGGAPGQGGSHSIPLLKRCRRRYSGDRNPTDGRAFRSLSVRRRRCDGRRGRKGRLSRRGAPHATYP